MNQSTNSYCKLLISDKYLPYFSDCNLKDIDEKLKNSNMPIFKFFPNSDDSNIHIVLSKKSNYSSINFQQNTDFFYHIENRTFPNNWEKDYYIIQTQTAIDTIVIRWNPRKQKLNDQILNTIIYLFRDYKNRNKETHIEVNPNKTWKYHLVQEDEDLYNISKEQNVTMHQIMEKNELSNSLLYVGQILEIPEDNNDDRILSEKNYRLKVGETLALIAQERGFTQEQLIAFNTFNSNLLNVGTVIKFPK